QLTTHCDGCKGIVHVMHPPGRDKEGMTAHLEGHSAPRKPNPMGAEGRRVPHPVGDHFSTESLEGKLSGYRIIGIENDGSTGTNAVDQFLFGSRHIFQGVAQASP